MKPYKKNVHITILTKTLSKEQHNLTFSEFYGFFFSLAFASVVRSTDSHFRAASVRVIWYIYVIFKRNEKF